jgi:hypothetical protein
MDMLSLMHEGTPYGHLTVGGESLNEATLGRMVGETTAKTRRLLAELELHKVFSRTDAGTIYSRRMVRDEHIRNVRAESGKLGGNPTLVDPPKDNETVNGLDKQTDNQKPTPSSSSSTSSASTPLSNTPRAELLAKLPDEYRPDLLSFLRGVGADERQLSWIKSIDAHLTGDRKPQVTPEVVGSCLRQFVGNGDRPNWRLFQRYIETEHAPPQTQSRNGKSSIAEQGYASAKLALEDVA